MITIGEPIVRVVGPEKVTGKAKYAAEFEAANLAYAYMVLSTVGKGRVVKMNTARAQRASGVITIMTPWNAQRLPDKGRAAVHPPAGRVMALLQDDRVHYNCQPIAVVVAETLNQAWFAASQINVQYQTEVPDLDFRAGFPSAHPGGHGKTPPGSKVGNVEAGLAAAEVTVDEIYTTPKENHNPMEPHATMAEWNGDKLTLHDSTQYISGVKQTVAKTFGIPEDNVRVICPFTGGGFGCKGSTWSHVVLAAMAATAVNRPVRLVLERPQMFGPVGSRPQTYQHIVRAPGEATGTFALEIAIDELAMKLHMDPVDLRMKNYAEVDPIDSKRFSSKHLQECYRRGAERFGWSKRNPQPRSHREGNNLVGYGMATATYPANRSMAGAMVQFEPTGRVTVASGTQDLGTGTYTIMAQVAAATLKLPIHVIDVKLGDTRFPHAPVSGGSQSAASVTPAVQAAAQQVRVKLLTLASNDPNSPLHGISPTEMGLKDGKIFRKSSPDRSETYTILLQRNGNRSISATATAQPDQDVEQYAAHSWGAVFAEVTVDELLGMQQVRRIVAGYDIGTLLSGKTGKSQLIGGIVWGVSLALFEETHLDARNGRPVNNNLAEYHVPVNADIGEIDVITLNIPDKIFDPLGARSIGEIGITGAGAAVANAIYHATGKRIREAPITPDKLMT